MKLAKRRKKKRERKYNIREVLQDTAFSGLPEITES